MARKIQITTYTTAAAQEPEVGALSCGAKLTCEGVHGVVDRPGHYYVIVSDVTDPDEIAAFAPRIGRGERLGRIERRHIDEVPRP